MAGAALAIGVVPASAQTTDDGTVCQAIDMGGTRLLKMKDPYTRTIPVAIPAGTVEIPRARAWDAYPGRSTTGVQASERYEVQFLDAAGNVVATSAPTGDVPDGLEEAEWVGSLGSVQLPVDVAGVRAHHRNDLPVDNTPDSVNAGDFTLCWAVAPTTTTAPSTTEPATTEPAPTEPTTTEPSTTEPATTVPGETTSSTNPDSTNPAGPTVPEETTSTTGATSVAPTTVQAATSTTSAPAAQPTLPVTGSTTWLVLLAGTILLSLGWGLKQLATHLE